MIKNKEDQDFSKTIERHRPYSSDRLHTEVQKETRSKLHTIIEQKMAMAYGTDEAVKETKRIRLLEKQE